MRIAIVDHVINYGGSSRVLRRLIPALIKINKKITIDFFCNEESFNREKFNEFKNSRINIIYLKSLKIQSNDFCKKYKIIQLINLLKIKIPSFFKIMPLFLSQDLTKELEEKLLNYDLIYFPWPFLIKLPNLNSPICATFHDFNFKNYFSSDFIYSRSREFFLNQQIPIWLKKTTPIVSNKFIKKQILKFYPKFYKKVHVIRLAPYSKEIFKKNKKNYFGKYILYPTNMASHKNLGPLIVSMHYLEKKVKNLKLILTGPNTDRIKGYATKIGLELKNKNQNVIGLGYVDNNTMENLIKNAQVIVSTSLYEADNGPCTDGWIQKIPVAMSRIESNIEHVTSQGVRAEIFDPFNPKDIARKIYKILLNKKKYKKNSEISYKNISKYTWDNVAKNYYDLFNKLIIEKNKKIK